MFRASWLIVLIMISTSTAWAKYPAPSRLVGGESFTDIDAQNRKAPPAKGAVLVLGDARLCRWLDAKDVLKPLTTVIRCVIRLTYHDINAHFDYLVTRYSPRAIVFLVGYSDVRFGVSPDLIAKTLKQTLRKTHDTLPGARIYALSVQPTRVTDPWKAMVKVNPPIRKICAEDKLVTFLDATAGIFDDQGVPKDEALLQPIGVRWNSASYSRWERFFLERVILVESHFE